ncbi:uncharacterized protein CTRU02_209732 [Colletotrichum truncatum]|uniref:Uncharacterized protein n=1 Tax=Colletotrichum truncatum TaxID=5467 RepID=A0ACC3YTC7_COLTU|nr:uncharacterized protein CTRU02_02300 [Colletotrichum truncatum]KAF6798327.1 hypothetical protein CTRU02_02300 [Colletotrichum truncatum]
MDGETLVELHDNWDAALVVNDSKIRKKFHISSQILSAASPYFKRLLTSDFSEGLDVQRGLRPEIILEGDSPDAMEIVLSILHYRFHNDWFALGARDIALVARCCDKYDCTEALRMWISHWLKTQWFCETKDFGYMLVAYSALRKHQLLVRMAKTAIFQLPVDFDFNQWTQDEVIADLPAEIVDHISSRINQVSHRLYNSLTKKITDLSTYDVICRMHRARCSSCLSLIDTKRQAICKTPACAPGKGKTSPAMLQMFCTQEHRVGEFLQILNKNSLLPINEAFEGSTIAMLDSQLGRVQQTVVHPCALQHNCPLRKALDDLEAEYTAAMQLAREDLRLDPETNVEAD